MRRRVERGSMAVEVVLMMPLLVMFCLLVVAGGRFVSARSDIEAAARDGARAASLERSESDAVAAARAAVNGQLDAYWNCQTADVTGFGSGQIVEVEVECGVPGDALGLIGLGAGITISATGAAPVDTYRRTG